MTYVIGQNRPKTPEKLYDNKLGGNSTKIKGTVALIRDESFSKQMWVGFVVKTVIKLDSVVMD